MNLYESKWWLERVRKATEELDKQTIKRLYELQEKINKEKEVER